MWSDLRSIYHGGGKSSPLLSPGRSVLGDFLHAALVRDCPLSPGSLAALDLAFSWGAHLSCPVAKPERRLPSPLHMGLWGQPALSGRRNCLSLPFGFISYVHITNRSPACSLVVSLCPCPVAGCCGRCSVPSPPPSVRAQPRGRGSPVSSCVFLFFADFLLISR